MHMTKITLTLRGAMGGNIVFSGSSGLFCLTCDRTSDLAHLVDRSGVRIREGWIQKLQDGTVVASMVAEGPIECKKPADWVLVSAAMQAAASQSFALA
jgi:hypothetical protein